MTSPQLQQKLNELLSLPDENEVVEFKEAKNGYVRLYLDHVQQAHQGADMDFLVGCRGSVVKRDSH